MATESIPMAPFPLMEACICDFMDTCACGPQEKHLRLIADGRWANGKMTAEQREWCIDEAVSAGEGAYRRDELVSVPDDQLARTVLDAWRYFARSQGMY